MKKYYQAAFWLVVGLGGAAFLANQSLLPNPLFIVQADVAALLSRLGIPFGLLVVCVAAATVGWKESRVRKARAEAQLSNAAARRRFLFNLEHEIGKPLSTIQLAVKNLEQPALAPPEQKASLNHITRQAQHLNQVFASLLELAEIETMELEKSGANLIDVMEEAISLVGAMPDTQDRSITVKRQRPWPLARVWGDYDLLVIVFRNLLTNAVKYSPADSEIEVRLSEERRRNFVVVEVADKGWGIPPADLPHVWEPLYRAENVRTLPGSGLGLALVKQIVERLQGEIDIDSRLEQGTIVAVRLPVAPESDVS